MSTTLKLLAERSLKKIYPSDYTDDWALRDDEWAIIQKEIDSYETLDLSNLERVIKGIAVIDTKTHRLINEGCYVLDGIAHFGDEVDAVEFLNKNGFACERFEEAVADSRALHINECHWFVCDASAYRIDINMTT